MPMDFRKRWRIYSHFTEYLILRRADVRKEEAPNIQPALFVRSEICRWLTGSDFGARRILLEIYEDVTGISMWSFAPTSEPGLESRLVSTLEEAFDRGELVALRIERPPISLMVTQRAVAPTSVLMRGDKPTRAAAPLSSDVPLQVQDAFASALEQAARDGTPMLCGGCDKGPHQQLALIQTAR